MEYDDLTLSYLQVGLLFSRRRMPGRRGLYYASKLKHSRSKEGEFPRRDASRPDASSDTTAYSLLAFVELSDDREISARIRDRMISSNTEALGVGFGEDPRFEFVNLTRDNVDVFLPASEDDGPMLNKQILRLCHEVLVGTNYLATSFFGYYAPLLRMQEGSTEQKISDTSKALSPVIEGTELKGDGVYERQFRSPGVDAKTLNPKPQTVKNAINELTVLGRLPTGGEIKKVINQKDKDNDPNISMTMGTYLTGLGVNVVSMEIAYNGLKSRMVNLGLKTQMTSVCAHSVWNIEGERKLVGISLSRFYEFHPIFGRCAYLDILCNSFEYQEEISIDLNIGVVTRGKKPKPQPKEEEKKPKPKSKKGRKKKEEEEEVEPIPVPYEPVSAKGKVSLGPVLCNAFFYEAHRRGFSNIILCLAYTNQYGKDFELVLKNTFGFYKTMGFVVIGHKIEHTSFQLVMIKIIDRSVMSEIDRETFMKGNVFNRTDADYVIEKFITEDADDID